MSADEAAAAGITGSLVRISNERHIDRVGTQVAPAGQLFHYTTAVGLKGIVETNCLHASGAYFLNDSSEVKYGREVLNTVLEQWQLDNPESRDDVVAEVLRDVHASICQEERFEALVRSIHLACFCERDNLLSQWRCYGQEGGYSIGFPVVAGAIRGLAPEPASFTGLLVPVEYDRFKQARRCKDVIDRVVPILDDRVADRVLRTAKALTYHGVVLAFDYAVKIVEEMLLDEILAFKDKAFEEEHEWRLIVRPRALTLHAMDDRGKSPVVRHFRCSGGLIVPYLKLVPLNGKLPIVSVRSGPSVDSYRAQVSVRMLLEQHGFSGVELLGSDIPVKL